MIFNQQPSGGGFHFSVPRCHLGRMIFPGLLALLFALAGCGYHVAGKGNALPASIQSIAIPTFLNKTSKYRLEQHFTASVIDEFVARTKYRITQDPAEANALLSGEVLEFNSWPVIFSGDAGSTFQVIVRIRMTLEDKVHQKFIFQNRDFQFREEFEISRQSGDYFPEEGPALERLSREFARTLVSNILDNF